jgi:subtilisin family serine protease
MNRISRVCFVVASVLFAGMVVVAQVQNPVLPREVRHVRNAVADQYLVVFRDERVRGEDVDRVAAEVSLQHGAEVQSKWRHALRGFGARMTAGEARALAQDPRVAFVEEDSGGHGDATIEVNPTWGLDRIDQHYRPLNQAYLYNGTGAGVNVYVVDSGIRTTHAEFEGRAFGGSLGFTAYNDGWDTNDCYGHGTHVAGTIGGRTFGVAKSARLFSVRVLDCNNNTTVQTTMGPVASWQPLIDGINWVIANHVSPAVANMSLSGSQSATVDTAVRNLIAAGVTVVVAAGNKNLDASGFSPADVTAAIVVGASDSTDGRALFGSTVNPGSNYGRYLDLFAPGQDVTSAYPIDLNTGLRSDTATAIMSGTSMAAPHVAGAAALYLAGHPAADPRQVSIALTANATSGVLATAGTNAIGAGSPNLLLFESFIAAVHVADVTADGFIDAFALSDTAASLDSAAYNWQPRQELGSAPCAGRRNTLIGDVNGDRLADVVCINDNNIIVSLSAGSLSTGFSLRAPVPWLSGAIDGDRATLLADVNRDGRADVIAVNYASGVWVSLSTGSGFAAPRQWAVPPRSSFTGQPGYWGTRGTFMADVNGDGQADIVAINDQSVTVALSTGTSFNPFQMWAPNFSVFGERATAVADVDGDGRADLVGVNSIGTWVALSTGSGFALPQPWAGFSIYGTVDTVVADLNGDGMADLVAVDASGIWGAFSWGGGFTNPQLISSGAFFGTH